MQSFAAKLSVMALLVSGTAHGAGVIEETGRGPVAGAMGGAVAAPLGVGENRPMRTSVSLNVIQAAFDKSDPRDNIQIFKFDRGTIYKLRQREFMSTTVVLPPGESIAAYNLPDKENFTFTQYAGKDRKKADPDGLENVFSVQPKYPGADTNLTIFGRSGRIYNFYLRVDSVKSEFMPVFTAYIEDADATPARIGKGSAVGADKGDLPASGEAVAKPAAMTGEDAAAEAEYLRSLPLVDPSKINIDGYKIAGGDKALAPVKIFDDGYWTYFKLSNDKNLDKSKVPAIYRVVDGYDTPVNTRVEGGTIIAETMSKGWTLRAGEAHLCIRAK